MPAALLAGRPVCLFVPWGCLRAGALAGAANPTHASLALAPRSSLGVLGQTASLQAAVGAMACAFGEQFGRIDSPAPAAGESLPVELMLSS